ncbi:hypothetical protein [Staphylococcus sp. Marseille-Q6910]|uniref:hypothetical protein n=1 Tax=Staphylococcus sp. Marseille-Q6910 TaxID=2937990 RepID=UPI00203DF4EE|nr:hypothetical protein [Staphylococcus sp. Marseille-Q6910]
MLKTITQSTILDSMQLAIDLEENNNELDDFLYSQYLEDEIDYINSELFNFIEEYEQRYHTKIAAIAFVGERFSWYGSIGGNGTPVGTDSESLRLTDCLVGCDDFAFNITEDKHLELVKMDHDGNNSMKLRLVTKNEFETYQYYSDDYLNLAEFIYKLGKKPTKVSNTFLDNYI